MLCPVRSASLRHARRHTRLDRRSFASHVAVPGQSYIEKVVQRHVVDWPEGRQVRAGDFVMLRPQHVMTHDNTGPVISKFKSIGAKAISNPRQPVFTLDHDVQNKSAKNLEKYAKIEAFAMERDIDFYPAGRGIGHQVMIEEGYAFPHTLCVASDSHSNMYGGVGCVGTPIVRTDAAAIWATQRTWWQVPTVVQVELTGRLAPGVTGKDVIVALCGNFNRDEVLNCAIEFVGAGVSTLSVDERLAIANMTTEWGALAGVFPVDSTLLDWYHDRIRKLDFHKFRSEFTTHPRLSTQRLQDIETNPLRADPDAHYAKRLTLDLSSLVSHVSGPNSVKISTPLPELEARDIKIHKAYLVSCTNSRASDLAAAARVLRGQRVASGVEFYVAAASSVVQREAEESGDWGAIVDAGARVLPAGCGPCIGLGTGLLEDGQVGISATNRNYKGRMGSPNAQAYLASPEVVAASAIAGKICAPKDHIEPRQSQSPTITLSRAVSSEDAADASVSSSTTDAVLPLFPEIFSGPLLFAPQDNLNTDALYPGKYTYQDDITPDRQAEVLMENYDPSFASLVASIRSQGSAKPAGPAHTTRDGKGVLFASGYNFGTGSSREQAATALRNAGIPLVIAGSFGDIFKRNAINNALICLECPDLVDDLTTLFGKDGKRGSGTADGHLTAQTGWQISVGSADVRLARAYRKSLSLADWSSGSKLGSRQVYPCQKREDKVAQVGKVYTSARRQCVQAPAKSAAAPSARVTAIHRGGKRHSDSWEQASPRV
ncbi:uncharacterized protein L969DRAFT_79898 [Mixia osmundae IAM 14324]|uniref:Homoaconitase, mitochondrial n=1 Tax=Mixia osmundae (strain CBS 9802 / IAM 14324 / JCM 22182 / KY 12970) TaxID=764103 RepID=G7DW29_MIXOS|nr:uncharacterized protein L969DRAFT_79898 [Mixia osmundae IAM 14324]KEI36465.1 hypothetical protein L969DRAFT_79898 [Mixia osmundae IAM 14324]GAA94835.1 hypothetical protein E5Q_01489 [Mixia osmundae IAM 14324]